MNEFISLKDKKVICSSCCNELKKNPYDRNILVCEHCNTYIFLNTETDKDKYLIINKKTSSENEIKSNGENNETFEPYPDIPFVDVRKNERVWLDKEGRKLNISPAPKLKDNEYIHCMPCGVLRKTYNNELVRIMVLSQKIEKIPSWIIEEFKTPDAFRKWYEEDTNSRWPL